MRTRLLNYWGQDSINNNQFLDMDYANGVVYVATSDGVYGHNIQSRNNVWDWHSDFHAEAIQSFHDELILIGETEFLKLNENSKLMAPRPIQLPFENLSSKTVKKTLFGREKIIHTRPSPPRLFKDVRVRDDKLFISYHFDNPTVYYTGSTNIIQPASSDYSVICVYSLPELSLVNHFKLKYPDDPNKSCYTAKFDVKLPYIFYDGGRKSNIYRLNMESGALQVISLPSNNYIDSIAVDEEYIYVNQYSILTILSMSKCSIVQTINTQCQLSEINEVEVAWAQKLEIRSYEEFVSHCNPKLSQDERDAYWTIINWPKEQFHSVMDSDADAEHGLLAIATELGSVPAFLWDTKKRYPIGQLLGHREVSRRIKIRYPYILSTAFEDAHVWEIIEGE